MAIKGHQADGHDYMDQAFENGAAAVIAQENPKGLDRVCLVPDTRKAAAVLAASFYGHPSKDLVLVGITGTNGKTTTTWILESIFKAGGCSCGVMGTINVRYGDTVMETPETTPDAFFLQKALRKMKEAGVTHVIMEVSSHSLAQYRVDSLHFNAKVFTNLTRDHLDYHGTMADYFQCKQRFFTGLEGAPAKDSSPVAVINTDHDPGRTLKESLSCPCLCAGTDQAADVRAWDIVDDITGLSGTIGFKGETFSLSTCLTGRFNLENILCAAGAAWAVGVETRQIQAGIQALANVPGRLGKNCQPIVPPPFCGLRPHPGCPGFHP